MSEDNSLQNMSDADFLTVYKGMAAKNKEASTPPRAGFIPGVTSARNLRADARAERSLQISADNAARADYQASLANARADKADTRAASAEARALRLEERQDIASRRPPPNVMGGYLENKTAILKLNKAIKGLKGYPNAVGLQNLFGDSVSQRLDPNGVAVRADIADIGSLKIHDRSGGAVTVSEAKRLTPFIPSASDTPETANKKLARLLSEIEYTQSNISETYDILNEDSAGAKIEKPEKKLFTTEKLHKVTKQEDQALKNFLRTNPSRSQLINFFENELFAGKLSLPVSSANSLLKHFKKGTYTGIQPVPHPPGYFDRLKNKALSAVVGATDTFTAGYLPEIAGGIATAVTGDSSFAEKAKENQAALKNQEPGAFLVGQVAGAVGGTAALGAGAAKVGAKLLPSSSRLLSQSTRAVAARGIATETAYGALYGSGSAEDGERAVGALKGAAIGAVGSVAGRALIGGAARVISPRVNEFVKTLREAGVKLTPGQSIGPKSGKFEGVAGRAIPGVGDVINSAREESIQTFNTAFLNEGLKKIDAEIPMNVFGTAAMARAKQSFDDAYETVLPSMSLKPDAKYIDEANDLLKNADNGLMGDAATVTRLKSIFESQVGRKLRAGPIDGKELKRTTSELNKQIEKAQSSQNADLAEGLIDIKTIVQNAARRSSPAEAVARLDAVDEGYALFVRAQSAAKSAGGDTAMFTPFQLSSAIQRGDSSVRSNAYLRGEALGQDFAEAGKRIIGSNTEGSPTAGRVAIGLIGAGGLAYLSPAALGGALATTAAYAPGVRNVVSSAIAGDRGKIANRVGLLLRKNKGKAGRSGSAVALPQNVDSE